MTVFMEIATLLVHGSEETQVSSTAAENSKTDIDLTKLIASAKKKEAHKKKMYICAAEGCTLSHGAHRNKFPTRFVKERDQ